MAELIIDSQYVSKVKFGKEKYNKLTLLKTVGYFLEGKDNKKRAACNFKCDCGNIVTVRAKDVKSGKIKSCGCEALKSKSRIGKRNKLPDCKGLKNLLFSRFKIGAQKRKIKISISQEEFEKLIFSRCFYCNSDPSNEFKHNMHCQIKYNGIDRKNSKLPYTSDNVVACCKFCN